MLTAFLQERALHWDDLRFFLAVARSRTLGEAAQRLKVDATTVSRRIDRLAQELNTQLFEAAVTGYRLTATGQHLLTHAEEMERSSQSIMNSLTGGRSRLEGSVRLSVSEGFATTIVAKHMALFQQENPAIDLEIATTNGFLNPSKREADLAVMLARPRKGPLIARKLTDYALGLYAAKSFFDKHPVRDLADLNHCPLIGYIPDFIYAKELRYLEEISPNLNPTLTSSSINVQHALTRAGCGVAILPRFMARDDQTLVPVIPEMEIMRSFWIVVHQDMIKVARVRAVVEWLDRLTAESVAEKVGR